ncbi:MAG: hypothetical protein LBM98_08105 [Oscillospiraceae bacterium]|jgi:hypothetical protein|nr:hypothetical protein [Oscillospiraceae bacterium]
MTQAHINEIIIGELEDCKTFLKDLDESIDDTVVINPVSVQSAITSAHMAIDDVIVAIRKGTR